MTPRALAAAPSLILVAAVAIARLSGNDKAPFLVIAALALIAVSGIAAFPFALRSAATTGKAVAWCLGTLVPLLYAAFVLVLTRRHVIDSLNWLGFR